MGFWGSLGKGLLKAAPIAANFIPGVGPLASMAIGAGTNALSKKLEGGSWKGALGNAAMGAGMSYAGSKIPGMGGGIGPQSSMRDKLVNAGQQGLDMFRRGPTQGQGTGTAVDRPQGGIRPSSPSTGMAVNRNRIQPNFGAGGGGGSVGIPDQPQLDILSRMRGDQPQDMTPGLDFGRPRRPIAPQFGAQGAY